MQAFPKFMRIIFFTIMVELFIIVRWQLTPAESEIGLLLLKGFSHQEIANLRTVSERTVREQARALYSKAGLTGSTALSAFCIEDLLLPA
jgi:DNA-binding NarL/FixJ family response regulator